MLKKIGFITVGQSPRKDVVPEMAIHLGKDIEILEAGALDGLTLAEIEEFKPEEGDLVLASTLRDGTAVVFAEKYIKDRLQDCIYKLEEEGADLIAFICTGDFPWKFQSNVPIIFPSEVLRSAATPFVFHKGLTVFTPDEKQMEYSKNKWKHIDNVKTIAANPYKGMEGIINAGKQIPKESCDLIVLDCIGYNLEMQNTLKEMTNIPVMTARSVLARLLGEIF
ncbi:AroM family protein [Anaeropeptidivorans aminofermentans]|jgi:protein AroM|uniref:AroM family protein n=1 Tax=Anaeropeptidivorans aminofermentans TaxID=2934315 RepID=UPI00202460CA|nr:AroM family protein [Anaeropeptidivorans aminofermentans]MBE6013674.1 AroM family protein [Lachnospiraceae bacterium]